MLLGAVLLADVAGTVDLSNRTEFRLREQATSLAAPLPAVSALPAGTPYTTVNAAAGTAATPVTVGNPGYDLVDIPTLRIDMKEHEWESILDYSPFIILPDLELGFQTPQVLNSADLGVFWHDRRVRLGLVEYGQYGEENSLYLGASGTTPPPAGGSTVQLLATPSTINYGSSRTDLTTRVIFSRRWLGTSVLEYFAQGGLDSASRAVLPIVSGPRAEAVGAFKGTRLDTFETKWTGLVSMTSGAIATAAPTATTTTTTPITTAAAPVSTCVTGLITPLPVGAECSPEALSMGLTETWRRQLSRHSEGWLGAGPGIVFARLGPEFAYSNAVYPTAAAGFQYRSSVEQVRTVLRLDAQLAPLVDVRTGIIDNRAQATLSLTLPLRDVTMIGALSGTRSIDSLYTEPVTSVQGNFEIEYRIERWFGFGGGVRYAWQEQPTVGTFSTGLLFVQATFRSPTLRF
jgi:hypothetical protein